MVEIPNNAGGVSVNLAKEHGLEIRIAQPGKPNHAETNAKTAPEYGERIPEKTRPIILLFYT